MRGKGKKKHEIDFVSVEILRLKLHQLKVPSRWTFNLYPEVRQTKGIELLEFDPLRRDDNGEEERMKFGKREQKSDEKFYFRFPEVRNLLYLANPIIIHLSLLLLLEISRQTVISTRCAHKKSSKKLLIQMSLLFNYCWHFPGLWGRESRSEKKVREGD